MTEATASDFGTVSEAGSYNFIINSAYIQGPMGMSSRLSTGVWPQASHWFSISRMHWLQYCRPQLWHPMRLDHSFHRNSFTVLVSLLQRSQVSIPRTSHLLSPSKLLSICQGATAIFWDYESHGSKRSTLLLVLLATGSSKKRYSKAARSRCSIGLASSMDMVSHRTWSLCPGGGAGALRPKRIPNTPGERASGIACAFSPKKIRRPAVWGHPWPCNLRCKGTPKFPSAREAIMWTATWRFESRPARFLALAM